MPAPGVNAIVEITTQLLSGDPPKDYCTNTLCFNTTAPSVTTAQWQTLVDTIKGIWFATASSAQKYGNCGGKVVAYDRAQATPRPEAAVSTYTPTTWLTTLNVPRQVSMCVSFYAARNLKRKRGRIYLPPAAFTANERPGSGFMTACMTLVTNINTAVLGLTPVWNQTVHSNADNMDWGIDHWWVNDVYDTQRRRAPKETLRVHSP